MSPGLVGFVGLGNMGAHMARNLLRAGRPLIVFDVDAKRVAELKSDGAAVAKYPADVAAASKQIVTMLPSSPHVRSVFGGDGGLLEKLQPQTLCLDSSTIDQAASIEVSALVAKKGGVYLDAPVSGGVVGAQQGTLTFMVGGGAENPQKFDEAKQLLQHMGKNIVDCGRVGNGQAAKICNNMLLAIEMIGVAETFNLGVRMGLDPKLLASIVNTSSGRCWSSDTYNPVPGVIDNLPASRDYAGGFAAQLMAKDLSLAQNAATNVGAPTPLGSLSHQLYRLLANLSDYATKDFGVVYKLLQSQNKPN